MISCFNISNKGDSNTFGSIVFNPCKEAGEEGNIKTKHLHCYPVGNRYSSSLWVLYVHYCMLWPPFPARTICSKKCTYASLKQSTPQAFS